VATWAWPIWVVSRRRVFEAVFILLEFPSPSRRIFISSHSLPPSLVRRIGPSVVEVEVDIVGVMATLEYNVRVRLRSSGPTSMVWQCDAARCRLVVLCWLGDVHDEGWLGDSASLAARRH
jgi:hypothetical protein